MGKITLSQSGIEFIIKVPDGKIKIKAPNGGKVDLDQVVRIVSIESSKIPQPPKAPETPSTGEKIKDKLGIGKKTPDSKENTGGTSTITTLETQGTVETNTEEETTSN